MCELPRLYGLLETTRGDLMSANQVEKAIGTCLPDEVVIDDLGRNRKVRRSYVIQLHRNHCHAQVHYEETR